MSDVAVIILTLNEQRNLPGALDSVRGWADGIYVLDSYSDDATVSVAEDYGCHVEQREFTTYSDQRDYALDNLPVDADWALFLDADERVSDELKRSIFQQISGEPDVDGYLIKRKFLWMGTWIKHGYYPIWLLRLVRPEKAHYPEQLIDEHPEVEGDVGRLEGDLIHDDQRGVGHWIDKHNEYARLEAKKLLQSEAERDRKDKISHSDLYLQFKQWLEDNVWYKLPLFTRPFALFTYRYILRGGFLDGKEALSYHFLHSLWYRFLVDLKYREMKKEGDNTLN